MHTAPPPVTKDWYFFEGMDTIDTPALVVFAEAVRRNIDTAIAMAGGVERLRPHMKTNKCAAVCTLMLDAGISRFKCATIAEAELLAQTGAPDVLLAYQPVGPKVDRLLALIGQYPATRFSCLVDHPVPAKALAAAAFRVALTVTVYVDVNVGMNRSGIAPGLQCLDLYETCSRLKGLAVAGFHVYEGHITQLDLLERQRAVAAAYAPVTEMRNELEAKGLPRPALIAGGSPTFPIHAGQPDRECSPGTFVYWDAAYAAQYPEQNFEPAALLLTRVVSAPRSRMVTLDLGHKAVAAESDLAHRFSLLQTPDAVLIMHSEEHAVMQLPEGSDLALGTLLFAQPWHVCPTVALHQQAYVVDNGKLAGVWPTLARNRCIGI